MKRDFCFKRALALCDFIPFCIPFGVSSTLQNTSMLHYARRVKLSLGTKDCQVAKQASTAPTKSGISTQASTAVRHGRGDLNHRLSWSKPTIMTNPPRRGLQIGVGSEEKEEKKLNSTTSEIWPSIESSEAEAREKRSLSKSISDKDDKKRRRARVEAIAAQREFHDLRRPHEWYPIARGMKRHIIMHVGPTNSGKTHSALQRLKEAKKGVYCGPLRLLAEQVFERLNLEGVPCDLVTGEKVIRLDSVAHGLRQELEGTDENKEEALMNLYSFDSDKPFDNNKSQKSTSNNSSSSTLVYDSSPSLTSTHPSASQFSSSPLTSNHHSQQSKPSSFEPIQSSTGHVSCTVEMTDVREEVDVALIDEYQLIGDESRGWAWTRALLGVPAKEVHLCGDTSAIDLVKSLLSSTGDEITVKYYDRLSPLSVSSHSLSSSSYRPILSGDGTRELRPQSSTNKDLQSSKYSKSSSRSTKSHDFSHHRKFEWIKRLRDGDAVIVFSRKAVFQFKKEIEERLGKTVCVVYGSLPPETRSQQAKRFNSTDENEFHSEYALGPDGDDKLIDLESSRNESSSTRLNNGTSKPITSIHDIVSPVTSNSTTSSSSNPSLKDATNNSLNPSQSRILVATDAIGLGLNLNIRRIIFTALDKFDGVEKRPLRSSEVRQIGGRAGRFQSLYPHGEVTSIENGGVPFIRQAFMAPVQPQTKAGLFPTFEHIQRFQNALSSYIVESTPQNNTVTTSRKSSSSSMDFSMEKTKRSLLNSIRRGKPLPNRLLEGSKNEYDNMMHAQLDAMDLDATSSSSSRGNVHSSKSGIISSKSGIASSKSDADSSKSEIISSSDNDFSPFESDPHLFGVYEPRLEHHSSIEDSSSSSSLPDIKLGEILDIYEEIANLSGLFFLCSSDDHKRLAQAIDHLELSLREKYTFVLAPVNSTDPAALHFLSRFASLFSKGFDVPAPTMANMAAVVANPPNESRASSYKAPAPRANSFRKEHVPLRQWEQMYKILDIYLWLSYRFEGFVGVEEALESKIVIENEITNLLDFNPFPDGDMSRRGSRHPNQRDKRRDNAKRSHSDLDSFKSHSRPSTHHHDRQTPSMRKNNFEDEEDMFEDKDGLLKFKRRRQQKTIKDFGFAGDNGNELIDLLTSLSAKRTVKKKKAITSLKKKVSKKKL